MTISDNSATTSGGAIGAFAGTLNVSNSTFRGNSAGQRGGAIHFQQVMNVTRSTFIDNVAGESGGGIYYEGAATLEITDSSFIETRRSGAAALRWVDSRRGPRRCV